MLFLIFISIVSFFIIHKGIITYFFEDIFTDPYDLLNIIPGEWNPDGKPYKITDTWQKEINGDF